MNQIVNVYDILKAQTKFSGDRYRGEFGVEIETETEKSYEYPKMKFWNTTKDNSLRDWGVEYVLKAPMNLPEFEKALEEFAICEKKYKFRNGSVSTSVHVHVNMHNDSFLTVANFCTAYALVENNLIRYSGPDRLSNLFCLPMCDAEGVVTNIVNLLSFINRNMYAKIPSATSTDRCKYGAINPAPLTTLGTIEIRSFRGETDTKIIQRWVEIIKKLKDFSKREGLTPPDILKMWKDNKSTLLDIIFQEYASEIKYSDTDELIKKNLKYAADIACVSKDWLKFGILKVKPIYKEIAKPKLDELSNSMFQRAYDSLNYHERLAVSERYQTVNPNVRIVDLSEDL
jgi:hypothetical protein